MAPNQNVLGIRDFDPPESNLEAAAAIPKRSGGVKRKRNDIEISPPEEERRRQQKEQRLQKAAEKRNKIVVGIDFGTTFSGIAYGTTTKSSTDITVVNKWNGGKNDNLEKVPTRIALAVENTFDDDIWGYAVSPKMKMCAWFKLLLDGSTKQTDYDDELLNQSMGTQLMRLPAGLTAQEVTTAFLKKIYHHTIKSLEELIGRIAVEHTSIHFVITLPATWSLAARQGTRTAAQHAGIGSRANDDVTLIDEPEAAAVYAIKSITSDFESGPFKEKTCVTIIDGGGGTVDLCTYRIIRLQPLSIEEACVGQGGKCGGTTVDRALHELMQRRFGHCFSELDLSKIGTGSPFMKAFEEVKRDFMGDEDAGKCFDLPLKMRKLDTADPDILASYDFEDDVVKITAQDLETMFEPVVQKTFMLFRKQISRIQKEKKPAIRTVVLCGGLASAPYMRARFQKLIQENFNGKMELVTPERPWSAVARGAVISNLEKSPVTFRRCREHLGFAVHEKWDQNRHALTDRYEDPKYGPRAKNQMRWHVTRGEKISTNLKRPIECFATVTETDKAKLQYVLYQDLYGCRRKKAPTQLDDSVFKVGTLKIDLTTVVKAERTRWASESIEYPKQLEVDMTVEVTLGADKGVIHVTAKQGRKKFGTVSLEYEVDPAYKGILVSNDD